MDSLPIELKLQILFLAESPKDLASFGTITRGYRSVYESYFNRLFEPHLQRILSRHYTLALDIQRIYYKYKYASPASSAPPPSAFPTSSDLQSLYRRYLLTQYVSKLSDHGYICYSDDCDGDSLRIFNPFTFTDPSLEDPYLAGAYIYAAPTHDIHWQDLESFEMEVSEVLQTYLEVSDPEVLTERWVALVVDFVGRWAKRVLNDSEEGTKLVREIRDEDGWGDLKVDLRSYFVKTGWGLEIFEAIWNMQHQNGDEEKGLKFLLNLLRNRKKTLPTDILSLDLVEP